MYRLTVLYGHPHDLAKFDDYFHNVHLPQAQRFPGITRVTIGRCETPDNTEPSYYLVVDLYTATGDDMDRMLASPEGQRAAADLSNFATGGATLIRYDEQVIIDHPAARVRTQPRDTMGPSN